MKAKSSFTNPLCGTAPKLARSLKGSWAPRCWERQVQRQAARTAAMQPLCAWAKELAPPRPRLFGGPLFGECLESLAVEQGAPQPEPASPPPRSRRVDFPWEQNRTDRDSVPGSQQGQASALPTPRPLNVSEAAMDPARSELPGPLRLLPQVSRSLLERLAGGSPAGTAVPAPRRLLPASRHEDGVPPAHPLPDRWQGAGEWLRQAAKSLDRLFEQVASQPGFTSLAPVLAPSALTAFPAQTGLPWTARSWSSPLAGGPAPQALLARLVGRLGPGSTSVQPARRSGSDAHPAGQSAYPPGRQRWSGQGAGDHAQPAPVQPPASRDHLIADRAVEGPSGPPELVEPPGSRPPAPLTAPSLPPLVPPEPPYGQPLSQPPLPVAVSSLRQEARQETAITSEEDLDALAARIKRILDEEARRYGIDV